MGQLMHAIKMPGKAECPWGDRCHFSHDWKEWGRAKVTEKITTAKWAGGNKDSVLKALKSYKM